MPQRKFELHDGQNGSALAVRVMPGASKNHVSKILPDGTIEISLTNRIMDGRSNIALINFLSSIFEIPIMKITIVAGESYRDKLISILDVDAETVQERLLAVLK